MTQPDPRYLRSREAIQAAVRSILIEEGPGAISHQRVAEVAGVGRATVYRHWANTDDMVFDLVAENPFRLLSPNLEGPLGDRLTAWLAWLDTHFGSQENRALILHIVTRAPIDPAADHLRERRTSDLIHHLGQAVGPDHSWDHLSPEQKRQGLALLVGPLLFHLLMLNERVPPATMNRCVSTFLSWLDGLHEKETTA